MPPSGQLNRHTSPAQDQWVTRVLGVVVAPAGAGTPGLVSLQKSRLVWDALRKTVQVQLRDIETKLTSAVQAHNADEAEEDEYDMAEVAAGVRSIYTVLERLDGRLIDKLDEALNSEGAERERLQREARMLVGEYQAVVDTDPMLGRIDLNGFASTTIRSSAQATLAALAKQL